MELEEEVEALRLQLKRRNEVIEAIRKAYCSDVVAIKMELMKVRETGTDKYLPGTDIVDKIPSLDMRPVLELFSPEDSFLRLAPCQSCGGKLEIITRETKKVASLHEQISQLSQGLAASAQSRAELHAELSILRRKAEAEKERHEEHKRFFLEEMEKLREDCSGRVREAKAARLSESELCRAKLARKDVELEAIPLLREELERTRRNQSDQNTKHIHRVEKLEGKIKGLQIRVLEEEQKVRDCGGRTAWGNNLMLAKDQELDECKKASLRMKRELERTQTAHAKACVELQTLTSVEKKKSQEIVSLKAALEAGKGGEEHHARESRLLRLDNDKHIARVQELEEVVRQLEQQALENQEEKGREAFALPGQSVQETDENGTGGQVTLTTTQIEAALKSGGVDFNSGTLQALVSDLRVALAEAQEQNRPLAEAVPADSMTTGSDNELSTASIESALKGEGLRLSHKLLLRLLAKARKSPNALLGQSAAEGTVASPRIGSAEERKHGEEEEEEETMRQKEDKTLQQQQQQEEEEEKEPTSSDGDTNRVEPADVQLLTGDAHVRNAVRREDLEEEEKTVQQQQQEGKEPALSDGETNRIESADMQLSTGDANVHNAGMMEDRVCTVDRWRLILGFSQDGKGAAAAADPAASQSATAKAEEVLRAMMKTMRAKHEEEVESMRQIMEERDGEIENLKSLHSIATKRADTATQQLKKQGHVSNRQKEMEEELRNLELASGVSPSHQDDDAWEGEDACDGEGEDPMETAKSALASMKMRHTMVTHELMGRLSGASAELEIMREQLAETNTRLEIAQANTIPGVNTWELQDRVESLSKKVTLLETGNAKLKEESVQMCSSFRKVVQDVCKTCGDVESMKQKLWSAQQLRRGQPQGDGPGAEKEKQEAERRQAEERERKFADSKDVKAAQADVAQCGPPYVKLRCKRAVDALKDQLKTLLREKTLASDTLLQVEAQHSNTMNESSKKAAKMVERVETLEAGLQMRIDEVETTTSNLLLCRKQKGALVQDVQRLERELESARLEAERNIFYRNKNMQLEEQRVRDEGLAAHLAKGKEAELAEARSRLEDLRKALTRLEEEAARLRQAQDRETKQEAAELAKLRVKYEEAANDAVLAKAQLAIEQSVPARCDSKTVYVQTEHRATQLSATSCTQTDFVTPEMTLRQLTRHPLRHAVPEWAGFAATVSPTAVAAGPAMEWSKATRGRTRIKAPGCVHIDRQTAQSRNLVASTLFEAHERTHQP